MPQRSVGFVNDREYGASDLRDMAKRARRLSAGVFSEEDRQRYLDFACELEVRAAGVEGMSRLP